MGGRANLRPLTLDEYIGQEHIKEVLTVAIEAAKKDRRPLDHVLLNGPPGLGKTTLARIIGKEMGYRIKTTIGSDVKTAKSVEALAWTLKTYKKAILFIDEVHRVGKPAQEVLYPILEDGIWYYRLGSAVSEVDLGPLTVIGATTNVGKLEQPFVDRFALNLQMEYYTPDEMLEIVTRSAQKMGMRIDQKALQEVAIRSRSTPRIANNILKRLRDYQVARGIDLTEENVKMLLWEKLKIDIEGLNALDRKILAVLDQAVGPVGLDVIATLVGEEADSIESRVEPYLMQIGFITRQNRGRMITDDGRDHLEDVA